MGDKNNNPQYKGEVKREYIIFGDYILEGLGSLTYPDGDKYVGEWKDGKKHGQGIITYVDKYLGGKYSGGWKDGEFHGQGTETSILGFKYVGKYKDGKKHGQGTYTFSSGGWYDGSWKDGQSWTGITYDKNENITGKWVNGVLKE